MTNTITLKELRPELPKVIDRIDKQFDRYVVTKHGKPTVVMLGIDDYEALIETLDILADKNTMSRVRKGEKDIKAGRVKSWSAFKKAHE
ncbi:MAG: antitoxin YefM [Candidatus Omnitrophota bacterium]|jgi:antitoxin YefM